MVGAAAPRAAALKYYEKKVARDMIRWAFMIKLDAGAETFFLRPYIINIVASAFFFVIN